MLLDCWRSITTIVGLSVALGKRASALFAATSSAVPLLLYTSLAGAKASRAGDRALSS
jgi:hypothetical protein